MFRPRNSSPDQASIRSFRAIIRPSLAALLALGAIGGVVAGALISRARAQAQPNTITVVSAATFEESPIAPDSIAALFGQDLALSTASATGTPLPLSLAGATVWITDSAGVTQKAPLFFVSPQQINFLIPANVALGTARVMVLRVTDVAGVGTIRIASVSPGLFSANATGQGAALGYLLSVPEMGQSSSLPLAEFDKAQNRYVTRPLELDRQTLQAEKLFFVLFGAGVRRRESSGAVTAHVGGLNAPVDYAGPQGSFAGLDQINIPIDADLIRNLTGRGRLNIVVSVAGAGSSNAVEIEVAGGESSPGPKINSFSPALALAGDTVTVAGEDFLLGGVRPSARVGGAEASVIEASDTQLKIKVPFGAESGKISVRTLLGETSSNDPLAIRASISGIVEDAARRPIPNVAVRLRATTFGNALLEARTNSEGVFILADVPGDQSSYVVEVDGTTAGATPGFPRVSLYEPARQGRDNQITRPVSLQLATGAAIKVNNPATPNGVQAALTAAVPASATAVDGDWVQTLSPSGSAQGGGLSAQAENCLIDPGEIRLELPRDAQVSIPCNSTEECANALLYVTQVGNSRAPVDLPIGQFGSTMAQISPFDAYFYSPGALTLPNTDCLPAGAKVRLFVFGQSGSLGAPVPSTAPGRFVEFGTATVSPDAQRVTADPGTVLTGGIYFVSIARPTAAIFGRIVEPNDDPREPLRPVRRAVVTARGQEAVTDGNGAFALRGIPVLGPGDRTPIDITYLRPEGRVERAALPGVSIGAGGESAVGDLILSASNSNRPPTIIAAPAFTAEEGKRADLNFVAADPDAAAGQTLQVSVTGPSFATIIHRGAGGYSLRVAPGFEDAGNYTLTIKAADSQNAIATQDVALTVFNANRAPVAIAQSVTTNEDTQVKVTLGGADPDRNALSYVVVGKPTHGQLTGAAPDLTYLPDANYFGGDAFTFKVNDGAADSAPATVTITVNPVNDAPVLSVPQEQKVVAGAALKFAISATEFDPADSLTFTAADLPQGASFTQTGATGAQFSWTPTAQQPGAYVVTFKVADNGSPSLSAVKTVAITVVATGAGPSAGMWAPTAGPVGGGAFSLLASGQNVFAGSGVNGVFRSTDGGGLWKRASKGLPNFTGILAMAQVGDTIIASASFSLFRTTDNGETWAPANEGLSELSTLVQSLAVKGDLVFAGTFNGVYVSADRGKTWKAANKGLPTPSPVSAMAVSGSGVLAATNFSGIYRSSDDGQNWSRVENNLPQLTSITSFAVSGATVFAATFGDGVYRSTDGGQSWSPVSANQGSFFVNSLLVFGDSLLAGAEGGLFVLPANGQIGDLPSPVLETSIKALATNGATIYAGSGEGGVFRSTDGGKSWAAANNGFTNVNVGAFASTTSETFVATQVGVFAANNQALQSQQSGAWRTLNRGFSDSNFILSLAVVGTDLFAGAQDGLYRLDLQANEQNRVWAPANAGLPGLSAIRAIAGVDGAIYVSLSANVTPAPPGPSVYRSTDQGKNWVPASNGLPNGLVVSFATTGGKVFAATFGGVYVSSDNGNNWGPSNNGLPADTSVLSFAVSGARLFAGTAGRGVYVSADQGQNWASAAGTLPDNATVSSLMANGSNLLAVVIKAGSSALCPNGGVFLDGRCWGGVTPGALKRVSATAATDQLVGVTTAIPGAVYVSINGGRNWASIMSGLEDDSVTAIGANGADVFAGTVGRGVFTRRF
jgi:uncharacterized protein (TIGR03437 family)